MNPEMNISDSTTLFQVGTDRYVSKQQLFDWLPNVESALWFAKVFELNYTQVSDLLYMLFESTVMDALMAGDHSTDLQDYLVDVIPDHVMTEAAPEFVDEPAPGEILPELWKAAQIEVATAISEVAAKLKRTLNMLPSKDGKMMFSTMLKMNRLRPTLGDYRASITHQAVPNVAVVLDVSGSMTSETVRTIIDEVVSLAWTANAHLIIVSYNAYHWEPGAFSSAAVLEKAEFGGTYYEQLAPLFNQDWGTVITIADYDSSRGAQQAIAQCTGHIGQVLDISLVNRPTFLAECLGQLADKVTPLLIGRGLIKNWY